MARTKSNRVQSTFTPQFWNSVDGRTGIYKQIKQRYDELVEHTGADSAQKMLLCQRAVFLAIKLETVEVEASTTGELEFGTYCQAVNALVGILNKLGFEKQTSKVESVETYVKGRSRNRGGR